MQGTGSGHSSDVCIGVFPEAESGDEAFSGLETKTEPWSRASASARLALEHPDLEPQAGPVAFGLAPLEVIDAGVEPELELPELILTLDDLLEL